MIVRNTGSGGDADMIVERVSGAFAGEHQRSVFAYVEFHHARSPAVVRHGALLTAHIFSGSRGCETEVGARERRFQHHDALVCVQGAGRRIGQRRNHAVFLVGSVADAQDRPEIWPVQPPREHCIGAGSVY